MWTNQNFINTPKKEMIITPKGWVTPLVVEYALVRVGDFDPLNSVCFRIKGTNHTFAQFDKSINLTYHGEYKKYFEETLEKFREDFLSWEKDEEYRECEWRKEYCEEYKGRIIQ